MFPGLTHKAWATDKVGLSLEAASYGRFLSKVSVHGECEVGLSVEYISHSRREIGYRWLVG